MKILIVEDDTLLLQGLILAAQTEGYACDGVTTAQKASPDSHRHRHPARRFCR
ncbi:hypothetical protein ACUOFC_05460, partial [Escherichia sp. TWPC-MK]